MVLVAKTKKNLKLYFLKEKNGSILTISEISISHLLFYHISEKRFFFGTWLTVIFRNLSAEIPFRGLNRFTCKPTFIFFVSAPCGNTAWTWGTTELETIPPSGPIACTSCRIRETTAKYWGKSCVNIRVIRPDDISSNWLKSGKKEP